MPHNRLTLSAALTILTLLGTTAGCQAPAWMRVPADDVEPASRQRKQEALATFERKRDEIELAAAQARLQEGNLAESREQAAAILKRNPQHPEALALMRQLDEAGADLKSAGREVIPVAAEEPIDTDDRAERIRRAEDAADEAVRQSNVAADEDTDSPPRPKGLGISSRRTAGAPATYRSARRPAGDEQSVVLKSNSSESSGDVAPTSFSSKTTAKSDAPDSAYIGGAMRSGTMPQPAPPDPAAASRLVGGNRSGQTYDGGARSVAAQQKVLEALTAMEEHDSKMAGQKYAEAAAAEPDNTRILTTAVAMSLRFAQSDLALNLAKLAVSQHPEDAGAYRALGTVCYRQGDYPAARSALQRAISLDNAHPLSYFLMGSTLDKLGDSNGANRNFRRARELDPRYAKWH